MKTLPPSKLPVLARQLSMPLDSLNLRGLSLSERSIVVVRLATLLTAAAGAAATEEDDDDEQ
ncbi:hypothetical protein VQ042_25525 [Aurantimonas sp. A2-1-M11]|uniref:hypothetical protein n=1 Tax=Aurantimonas sp. A2-1-M11 TaxID=3113712 RepID=UPI002F92DAD9